mgnify:CR=1 FL=1
MLSPAEQETNIGFNNTSDPAWIFTYSKKWQKHLEEKLGLVPIMTNGFGGKEYLIDKSRIKMPRVLRKITMSAEQRKAIGDRLHSGRKGSKTIVPATKSGKKSRSK